MPRCSFTHVFCSTKKVCITHYLRAVSSLCLSFLVEASQPATSEPSSHTRAICRRCRYDTQCDTVLRYCDGLQRYISSSSNESTGRAIPSDRQRRRFACPDRVVRRADRRIRRFRLVLGKEYGQMAQHTFPCYDDVQSSIRRSAGKEGR